MWWSSARRTRILVFDLLKDFAIIQLIQFLGEGLCLKKIREGEPDDAESSQKSRDEAHDGVERTERVACVECRGEGVIRQGGEPLIRLSKSLSNASEITEGMSAAIHYKGEQEQKKPPPRQRLDFAAKRPP